VPGSTLPGSLWEKVPTAIVEADTQLRTSIVSWTEYGGPVWKFIKVITDSPVALLFFGVLLIALWVRAAREDRRSSPWTAWVAAVYVVFLAASDIFSHSVLKKLFGRLKPHVGPYVEGSSPPLSFPSNHAFNLAFALVLVVASCSPETRERHRSTLLLGVALVLLVGFSRVVVGEHFPLDVLGGWLFGAIVAGLLAPLFRFLTRIWASPEYRSKGK